MHASLAIGCIVVAVLLYIPGYFVFRAARFSRLVSIIMAPAASISGYAIMGIANYELGVASNVATVLGPTLLVALIAYFASHAITRKKRKPFSSLDVEHRSKLNVFGRTLPFEWTMLACYIIVGAVVCFFMFSLALVNDDAFYPRFDNQTHINLIKCYLDTGAWSSLHADRYLDLPAYARCETTLGGFYPSAWHALIALTCSITGMSVATCSNAAVITLASISLPAGAFLLNKALFPENRLALAGGAIIAAAFANYPWVFVLRGPTFPHMLGFAAMVPAMAVFILFLKRGLVKRKLASFCVFCLLAIIAMGLSHPSCVFSAFVFLAAFGGHYIDSAVVKSGRFTGRKLIGVRIGAIVCYIACIVVFWIICLNMPMLQGVLDYTYGQRSGFKSSIKKVISLNYGFSKAQPALVLAYFIGIIVCIRKRCWWILVPALYMAFLFMVARLAYQPITRLLTGFWYSTPYRIHSTLAVFLVPIASVGAAWLVQWLSDFVNKLGRKKGGTANEQGQRNRPNAGRIAGCALVVVFCIVQFAPNFTLPIGEGVQRDTAFGVVSDNIRAVYDPEIEHVYATEEIEFVNKVTQIVPDNTLVLNLPQDGSVFAYGANDLTTYYRQMSTGDLTKEATAIRTKLSEYANNPEVQAAVQSTGAQYLLQLDHGVAYEEGVWMPQYKSPNAWKGIDSVDDDTPGFELLLSEGDMRLYRIIPVSELA